MSVRGVAGAGVCGKGRWECVESARVGNLVVCPDGLPLPCETKFTCEVRAGVQEVTRKRVRIGPRCAFISIHGGEVCTRAQVLVFVRV